MFMGGSDTLWTIYTVLDSRQILAIVMFPLRERRNTFSPKTTLFVLCTHSGLELALHDVCLFEHINTALFQGVPDFGRTIFTE
jgi:hypothetical protein